MSAMANTTLIVTTVTKTANKEKTPKEADAALKANILDLCEEHYEDIVPVIMDKIRRDKRKEVHARLDFGENSRKSRRVREGSQNSSVGTLPARYRNPSERPKMRDLLKYNDGDVFDRLGHGRQSAFDRLSNTYSPSTTKSGSDRANSRYRSHNRGRPRRRESSSNKDLPRGIEESYERHQGWRTLKVKSKRRKPTGEEDLAVPWSCEEVDPFTPRIRNFKRTARVWFDELTPESIDGYKDHKSAFLTYFKQQKKYVKDLVEIHNIKQRDEETVEDFIERFKVETGRTKGAPGCMRISGFMHGPPLPSYEEKWPSLLKRKVIHRGNHRTSPSGMFQSEDLASEVSKGKDKGLTGLPPPLPKHSKKSSWPRRESSNRHHPW
nr:reverse transcriptase domain-containing protein [Tanacetum cinerariifolium]